MVWLLYASRHIGCAEQTVSWLAAVCVQVWLAPPLQSQISTWVPSVVREFGYVQALAGADRVQRDRSSLVPPPPPVVPPATRYMTVPCAGTLALIVPVVVRGRARHRSVRV